MTTNIFSLEGKTAVVIGGTSGIGRTLSLGLADAGADVIASARRREQVDKTAAEIEQRGPQTLRLCCDVRNRASLEELLAAAVRRFGKVDILINCAGKIKRMPTLSMPEEDWTDIVDTNLTGTLRACQIFGKHMLERGYGRIVNIASLSSFVAFNEVAAYAASKSGVVSITRSLAVEWAKKGVTVNAIAPGVFRTALNQELLRQYGARPGTADADTDGPLWQHGRACRSCGVPLLRRGIVRYWADSGRGRRLSGQRRQPIAQARKHRGLR